LRDCEGLLRDSRRHREVSRLSVPKAIRRLAGTAMATTEFFRSAATMDRIQKGWTGDQAAYVCYAQIPFDDVGSVSEFASGEQMRCPKPGRKFAKQVRKMANVYARSTRGASVESCIALAHKNLAEYQRLAIEAGEDYYAKRWEHLASFPDGL
jgi:hypothetical protein